MKIMKKLFSSGIILVVISIVIVVTIDYFPSSILRTVLGLLILVIFPGYFSFFALFPSSRESNAPYFLIVVLILGTIETIFTSYVLNFLPWGINRAPILYFQLSIIIITWTIAFFRRRRPEGNWRGGLNKRPILPQNIKLEGLDFLLAVILIATFGLFVSSLVYAIIAPGPVERFTEFYVLNQAGEFGYIDSYLPDKNELNVIVVVENHEREDVAYRIEAINGSNQIVVGELIVQDGEVWSLDVSLILNDPTILLLLYKGEETDPYRFLHLNLGA